MSKGDKIGVAIEGVSGSFDVTARQNGRTVEFEFETVSGVKWIVVRELTRGGTVVVEMRFPADKVLVMTRAVKEVVK